jgi:hypothetical protein
VSIGKRNFSQRWNVITLHKIISAYKWPAVKGLISFYFFIYFFTFTSVSSVSEHERKKLILAC